MPTSRLLQIPAATRLAGLSLTLLLAVLALALTGPASALARGGPGNDDPPGETHGGGHGADDVPAHPAAPAPQARAEVRAAGSCGRGATARLKIKERDGGIEAEFEINRSRPRGAWRVVIIHERRVEYRGRVRTNSTGWVNVHYRLPDFRGADAVLARAYGPRGITCTASAVMPGA
jgi:hypothetical protein